MTLSDLVRDGNTYLIVIPLGLLWLCLVGIMAFFVPHMASTGTASTIYLPALTVSPGNTARLLNGAPCYRIKAENGVYRLQGPEGFLGLGRVEDSILKTEKLFVERT